MIGRLTGRVEPEEDGVIVIDVGGVGYEVTVPKGALPPAPLFAGAITLFIQSVVRDDAVQLFGFATQVDRAVFRTLLGLSNVGPKTALAVLSAFTPQELARTVAAKDMARLMAVPGIGRKTAEHLILELLDKKLPVA
jgi:Holliday junction DNA helicase RuvA